MASPLIRRFPRELKNNAGKYIGLFAMMTLAIAFTSGFLLAASSIESILNAMRDDYNVEDGRFISDFETDAGTIDKLEALGCSVYENFSYDLPCVLPNSKTATARVYANRDEVDLPSVAEGQLPQGPGQIALDRVFMANNELSVGDTVELGGEPFTICGMVTLPDYQALFEDNANFLFNALGFTVALVDQDVFDALDASGAKYSYSFTLDDRSATDAQRVAFEEDMLDVLSDDGVVLADFLDSAANQGIGYALDDVEGDQAMWTALLFILIVIMGFVFVVLNAATIEAESAVIGTLLASGWRKGELLRHYLALPAAIGAIAALAGVVIGFSALADPMKNLYYNSYSIPPYSAQLNPRVLAITALLPYIMLVGIAFFGLARKLKCTPLQFLRHETSTRSKRHSLHLPARLPFTTRFRLRVFLRNLSQFVTLFFGIMFASMLMLFAMCLMPVMENYAAEMEDTVPAQHMYTLKAPLEIEGTPSQRAAYAAALKVLEAGGVDKIDASDSPLSTLLLSSTVDEDANPVNSKENPPEAIAQAEKFAVAQLETERALFGANETIAVYGIQEHSRYWTDIDVSGGKIWTSQGVLEKTKVKLGQPALFVDRFAGKDYAITVDEATQSATAMQLYMEIGAFNELFGNDADYFNGYASDMPLEFDGRYMASELTPDDMGKIAEQMEDSMGEIVQMFMGISVPIYLILVYLLTKTVIDRSARAISYMKVFGYRNREINRLYINSITTTVLVSLVASLPIIYWLLVGLLKIVFMRYTGNFPLTIPPDRYAVIIAAGAIAYAIVAFLHVRRIRKVPLALALKVQE